MQTLVGSQTVPYIFEDMVSTQTIANAISKMYFIGKPARRALGAKAKNYAHTEFAYQKTVDLWHDSMLKTIIDFPYKKKNYTLTEL